MARKENSLLYKLLFALMGMSLSACSSIQPIGSLGPKGLNVYSISTGNFMNSSQMLVVLDKKGNISAYSGGTVPGWGQLAAQTGASLATAGAIVYGARTIQQGLQNVQVKAKGIPSSINVNANANITGKGSFDIDKHGF